MAAAICSDFEFMRIEIIHNRRSMLFWSHDAYCLGWFLAAHHLERSRTAPEAGLWEFMLRNSNSGKIAGSLGSQVPVVIVPC